jgi:hypothetical protein
MSSKKAYILLLSAAKKLAIPCVVVVHQKKIL